MAPSPLSPLGQTARHGRGKHGGSSAKSNKTRGRGYSIVDERESIISKALTRVLKRTIGEDEEQEEGGEAKLVADSEGWVSCEDLLEHPTLDSFQITFPEISSLIASPSSKSRFALKSTSEEESEEPSTHLIRLNPVPAATATPSTPANTLTPLNSTTEDLPTLIVYETSYANYPLILASGALRRAGGQAHLQFASISILEDGTESRSSSSNDADVSIYIDLPSVLASETGLKWYRNENGVVVTEGDKEGLVVKGLWKKVVARRADIGVLFENGQVKKEVPVGLRGKGSKAKKGGKGKGWVSKELKDDSASE
jgi:RNA:NAD 2'-phosphotransferase (TPT1/KptA family)